MIGLGIRIYDAGEFNRRAAMALHGVDFGGRPFDERLAATLRAQIQAHKPLMPHQQDQLYRLVRRHRRQITDQLVVEHAFERATGADE